MQSPLETFGFGLPNGCIPPIPKGPFKTYHLPHLPEPQDATAPWGKAAPDHADNALILKIFTS
jgi:hypothetical protein